MCELGRFFAQTVTNVTGFAKTILSHRRSDIQFIDESQSYALALSRDTKHMVIDGQVCFTDGFLSTMSNHENVLHDRFTM